MSASFCRVLVSLFSFRVPNSAFQNSRHTSLGALKLGNVFSRCADASHLTRVEQFVGGSRNLRIDYTYDVYGNRLSRTEYDGSLSVVAVANYAFDGWKTNLDASGNAASFVGQENWDAWADLDATNALTTRRVFGNSVDSLVARVTSAGGRHRRHGGGVVPHRSPGHRARPRQFVGALSDTIAYDGFGNVVSETNSSFSDRYKYTGRELEAAAGLYNDRDRVLILSLGHFMTPDRMGFAAGDMDLYRYAGEWISEWD